jgi:hypothetical protein
VFSVLLVLVSTGILANSSFSQNMSFRNAARDIFDNKTLTVPANVKNFVILIPNEAHESPLLSKEQRLINQPYVPQNLISEANTQIIWFSGDVDHMRRITLTDENSKQVYNSKIKYNTASVPLLLNQSGKFTYFEKNVNKDDPKFVMQGSITITDNQTQANSKNKQDPKYPFDSLLVLMVPTNDIKKQIMTLADNKINVIDIHTFKDLRETGGGGANQTLLVLGTNNPLYESIKVINKITSSLPYS